MSQLAGRKLPQAQVGNTDISFVSAEQSDGNGNAALHAMILGGSNRSHSFTVNDGPVVISYNGEAAAGTDETQCGWRITKTTDVLGDGTEVVTSHAYLPARADLGQFADLAAIQAAYPAALPGNTATALDTRIVYVFDYIVTHDWQAVGSSPSGYPILMPPDVAKYGGFDHCFIDLVNLQNLVYDDPIYE